MSLQLELQGAFEVKDFDPYVLESLESIIRTSNISAEDLYIKWEEYSTLMKLSQVPSASDIDGFRSHITTKLQQKLFTKDTLQMKRPAKTIIKPMMTPIKHKKFELLSSPLFGGSAFSPGEKSLEFQNRSDKGKVVTVFNEHIQKLPAGKSNCSVSLVPGQQTKGYRYLYEKLTERGDLLDERIEVFADLIREHEGILI
jgi:hypothetical protein